MEAIAPDYILEGIFLFFLSLALAIHEIEIEGGKGWAKNLPTWKLSNVTRFSLFSEKRPLTGYHVSLGAVLLLLFHMKFLEIGWSLGGELMVLSKLLMIGLVWDFLWFVLNPEYGVENFERENIEWHDQKWLNDGVPLSYLKLFSQSLVLAGLASWLSGIQKLLEIVYIFTVNGFLTLVTIGLAPKYNQIRDRLVKL